MVLAAVLSSVQTRAAHAHIQLIHPVSRHPDQKIGPCGKAGAGRGTVVNVYESGSLLTVRWFETVDHPGYFRISFDSSGEDDFFDPDDFYDIREPILPVMLDGIVDRRGGGEYAVTVLLPDIECDRCTLQLVQVMTDKPPYGDGNDLYYQCADLILRRGAYDQPRDGVNVTATVDCHAGSSGAPCGALLVVGVVGALMVACRRRTGRRSAGRA